MFGVGPFTIPPKVAGESVPDHPDDGNTYILHSDGAGGLVWLPTSEVLIANFNPTFTVTENGGDFDGLSQFEKGYSAPSVRLVWSSPDAAISITNSDNLELNSSAINLDGQTGTGGSTTGGIYTASVTEPAVFDVDLFNNANLQAEQFSLEWLWPVYHGWSASDTLASSGDVTALDKSLRGSAPGLYDFSGNSTLRYLWICVPEDFGSGLLSSFKHNDFMYPVPFNAPISVVVTTTYGVVETYECYRSYYPVGISDIGIVAS